MTSVRQIVSGWLLVSNSVPLILSPNEQKVHDLLKSALSKHPNSEVQKITVHVERYKEIGRNLIQWKVPSEAVDSGIMKYRNQIVLATHATCWDWIKEKNKFPEDMDYNSMNQWLMDWMKYVTKEMD